MDQRSTWNKIVVKISEETSFHGVKQISEPQRFVVRRILWSLLVLGSSGVLILQFVLNLQSFISWPVSVDIKINYNDSILFPAITICNFNSFRAIAAFDKGYYGILNQLYSGKESVENITSENTRNLSLGQLNRETGHRLDDLVVSCTWEGEDCRPGDFKVSLTEFGQCYTFNSGQDNDHLYKAVISGSSGGLRLQLNVEQYQYMHGPNEGAGLKILVHQNDVQGLMKDQGVAIPPGSHAYIATKIVEIHNMKPKHGVCSDSVKLEFYTIYTIENCHSECKQKYLVDKCGCREFYMPHSNGQPELCSLEQYLTCGHRALDQFSNAKADCFCPVPCDSRMYETVVSHASTSNFDTESLLRSNLTPILQQKFTSSREINSRVNTATREQFYHLLSEFHIKGKLLQDAIHSLEMTAQEVEAFINRMYQPSVSPANFHVNRGFETLLYNLKTNYVQLWENYTKQSYDMLPTAYLDLEQNILKTMEIFTRKARKFLSYTVYEGLSQNATGQFKYRKLVILPLEEMLYAKADIMELAFNHTDDIMDRLDFPRPNPEHVVTKNGRYDPTINTQPILLMGVDIVDKDRIVSEMQTHKTSMRNGIAEYIRQIKKYVTKGGIFRRWAIKSVSSKYHKGEGWYNNYVYQIKENIIYKPSKEITEKRDEFKAAIRSIENLVSNVLQDLKKTKLSLQGKYKIYWKDVQQSMDMAVRYLSDFQVGRTELAELITFNKTQKAVREFSTLLKETRNQIALLQGGMDNLHKALKLHWVEMLTEPLTLAMYQSMQDDVQDFLSDDYELKDDLPLHLVSWIVGHGLGEENLVQQTLAGNLTREDLVDIVGRDFFLTPVSDIQEHLRQQHEEIRNMLDSMTNMTMFAGLVGSAYLQLKKDSESFLKESIVGTDFYRENFMRLDIYMQELRYEEITQQEAYSAIQLISDIGGSMGLFIGGSLLSVIEVFDIFIHHCTKSLLRK